jgi:hypothetical protein
MHLLAAAEGVQSITWFYLAHVEKEVADRAMAAGVWARPVPKAGSKNADLIGQRWVAMQRSMGPAFDKLQEAIVRGGFTGFTGEPDLFCYEPGGGRWFFAEAKGDDRIGDKQTNADDTGWFDISLKTLGEPGRVRVYRVAPS